MSSAMLHMVIEAAYPILVPKRSMELIIVAKKINEQISQR